MNTLLSFDSDLNALKRNFYFTDNNLLKLIFFSGKWFDDCIFDARPNLSICISIRVFSMKCISMQIMTVNSLLY